MTTVNSINNKNKVIPFHPAADIFPLLEGAEFAALVEDIKNKGLRYSIKLLGNKILDGRNRYRAAQAAGYTFTAFDFEDLPSVDPVSYVISANIRRRHLTPEDQTKYLAELVAKQPEKSDRQFAKETGVSHPTIAKARKRAEATGKALPVAKRVGADGKTRKQPAKKKKAKSSITVKDTNGSDPADASAEAIVALLKASPDKSERETGEMFDAALDLKTRWDASSNASRKKLIASLTISILLELLTQAQIDELKDRLLGTETPVIGDHPGLTNDPKKADIPLILQVQNRKPLTPEQQALVDAQFSRK